MLTLTIKLAVISPDVGFRWLLNIPFQLAVLARSSSFPISVSLDVGWNPSKMAASPSLSYAS